jgi:hypothetical protein
MRLVARVRSNVKRKRVENGRFVIIGVGERDLGCCSRACQAYCYRLEPSSSLRRDTPVK